MVLPVGQSGSMSIEQDVKLEGIHAVSITEVHSSYFLRSEILNECVPRFNSISFHSIVLVKESQIFEKWWQNYLSHRRTDCRHNTWYSPIWLTSFGKLVALFKASLRQRQWQAHNISEHHCYSIHRQPINTWNATNMWTIFLKMNFRTQMITFSTQCSKAFKYRTLNTGQNYFTEFPLSALPSPIRHLT